jgi:hypothetical protein
MAEPEPALKAVILEKLADSLEGSLPKRTPRELAAPWFMPGKATVVIGLRRVGKTTFLDQLRQSRLDSGSPRVLVPSINFEDERLVGLDASQLGVLLEEMDRIRTQAPPGKVLWCFDEIQVVPGWEKFVRRILDKGNADVAVSGSSADLLSREIATSLRGRAWTKNLFPFSFSEILVHQGVDRPKSVATASSGMQAKMERTFSDWLLVGGFPEAQGLDSASRRRLLLDYVDVAMLRDVVERHSISNVAGLRCMVRQLLGNAGSLFSVEKLHATLKSQGFAISRDTMHQMLAHLEDCFLVRLVSMESSSERQRMVNPRKCYPADTGLIPVFDRSGKANLGHALEGAVLLELEHREASVTYVKTDSGYEVDFLARFPDGSEALIQACADASAQTTAEREIRSLEEAGQRHPKARRLLLVMDRGGVPREVPRGIEVLPAWRWMLEG